MHASYHLPAASPQTGLSQVGTTVSTEKNDFGTPHKLRYKHPGTPPSDSDVDRLRKPHHAPQQKLASSRLDDEEVMLIDDF